MKLLRTKLMPLTVTVIAIILNTFSIPTHAQRRARPIQRAPTVASRVNDEVLLRIMQAEDERRWSGELAALLQSKNSNVRRRAALAAGRIGDVAAVPALTERLEKDAIENVRAMAAFALGEAEAVVDADGTQALIAALASDRSVRVRARAVEALGKIAAALPDAAADRKRQIGASILYALDVEGRRPLRNPPVRRPRATSRIDVSVTLAALTAALRARPEGASRLVQNFLLSTNAEVRATAANTLARLRAKDAGERLRLALNDEDAIVRANAARSLGAAEDASAFEALISRVTTDADVRVRVSAIRALSALRDRRAVAPLFARYDSLFTAYAAAKKDAASDIHPSETSELLELATAFGALLAGTDDEAAFARLRAMREREAATAPELEIAAARIAPTRYMRDALVINVIEPSSNTSRGAANSWRSVSSVAQALGEIAPRATDVATASGNSLVTLRADALIALRRMSDDSQIPALALSDVLRSLAAFKSDDAAILRKNLQHKDAFVRATAAELLAAAVQTSTQTSSSQTSMQSPTTQDRMSVTRSNDETISALIAALPIAMRDAETVAVNDAALAMLDALAKFATVAPPATAARINAALESALASKDYLVRRRAVALLEAAKSSFASNAKNYRAFIGTVATRNTLADYARALERRTKRVQAIIESDKGTWTIDLLPEDAPLTVDNFVRLANEGFFNNLIVHRVVPNFVMQDGDPRGDGNGGPSYQIRCEINLVPYARGAIGMALSGKDTGGSQWFATHSPQPHLDGGYTVFGQVTEGMEVVDKVVRGDRIRRVTIVERARAINPQTTRRRARRN